MPLSYEDLPTAIRDHIIWQLRKAKLQATLVMQKYTRGRIPRLAYKRAARLQSRRSGPNASRSHIMPFWLDYFRRDPDDADYREIVSRRRYVGTGERCSNTRGTTRVRPGGPNRT